MHPPTPIQHPPTPTPPLSEHMHTCHPTHPKCVTSPAICNFGLKGLIACHGIKGEFWCAFWGLSLAKFGSRRGARSEGRGCGESRRRGGHMRFHSRHSSAGVSSGNPASQRHYWIFLFFFFSLSRQGGESVCTGRIGEGGLNRVSLTSEGSAAGAWFSFTSADPRQNTARPFKAPRLWSERRASNPSSPPHMPSLKN